MHAFGSQTYIHRIVFFVKEIKWQIWNLFVSLSDDGPVPTSSAWDHVLKDPGTMLRRAAPYSSQANGWAEGVLYTMNAAIKQITVRSATK